MVHQFGKVGSTTLEAALRGEGRWPVYQTHVLRPGHRFLVDDDPRPPRGRVDVPPHALRSREVWRKYVQPVRPIAVVTPVREPVSRNVSAFFQNLHRFPHLDPARGDGDVAALVETFIERHDHDEPAVWFERQFRDPFGVDVYEHVFDTARGWSIIDAGPRRFLLLQAELSDEAKVAALRTLLNLGPITLAAKNVGDRKDYAEAYAAFRRRLVLPAEYLDRVLNSQYARHFYSEAQRDAARAKWGRRGE